MKDRAALEKKFWDRFAPYYDRFIDRSVGKTYAKLKDRLRRDLRPEDEVLELATGPGLLAFAVCDGVKSIIATDISERMIEVAREKQKSSPCANIRFQVEDAYHLSFPDASFDAVFASNMLHLLFEPQTAVREMKRVLRPGGRLVLATFCHAENLRSRMASLVIDLGGVHTPNKWSVKSYRSFLESQGLTVKDEVVFPELMPLAYLVATA